MDQSSEAVASVHRTEKQRCCGTGDEGDAGGGVNSQQRIPDDIIIEVLRHLPVKSLVRFKSVSKHWHSTISDPSFLKSHPSNSDGLLITFTDMDATSLPRQPVERFLRVFSDRTLHHQATVLLTDYNITQAINGLVCLYVNTDNLILLCNILSHEILKLPSPIFDTGRAKYYFGYDPVNELYKLLKISSEEARGFHPEIVHGVHGEVVYPCEILTLGIDSSWRAIPPATLDLKTQSICINGVLYWGRDSHLAYKVVAFDLVEEEFHIKSLPDYMTENNKWNRFNVMELGGRLTLAQVEACLFNDGQLILWQFDKLWTKHIVHLPTELSEEGCRFPVGSLPTGELLLADYRIKSPLTVYSYDHAKGKFEKFLKAAFPYSLALVCREAPRLQIIYHKVARLHHIIKGRNSVSSSVPLSDPLHL